LLGRFGYEKVSDMIHGLKHIKILMYWIGCYRNETIDKMLHGGIILLYTPIIKTYEKDI